MPEDRDSLSTRMRVLMAKGMSKEEAFGELMADQVAEGDRPDPDPMEAEALAASMPEAIADAHRRQQAIDRLADLAESQVAAAAWEGAAKAAQEFAEAARDAERALNRLKVVVETFPEEALEKLREMAAQQ